MTEDGGGGRCFLRSSFDVSEVWKREPDTDKTKGVKKQGDPGLRMMKRAEEGGRVLGGIVIGYCCHEKGESMVIDRRLLVTNCLHTESCPQILIL